MGGKKQLAYKKLMESDTVYDGYSSIYAVRRSDPPRISHRARGQEG